MKRKWETNYNTRGKTELMLFAIACSVYLLIKLIEWLLK